MNQKQRSLTLFGVILLLAGGIAAYAWLGVYQVGQKKDEQKDRAETLFTFKKEQVKKIALTARGQTVQASGGESGWTIDAPIKTGADKFAFDTIAERLSGLKEKRDIGQQSDLKQFGLDAPRIKAVLTLDDGKTAELDLGNDNPYDSSIYGKRGGDDRVAILDNAVKFPIDKGLFELREKRLFSFEDGQVKHLDVASPGFAFGVDRGADGQWKVTAPQAMAADSARCLQMTNALKNLRATRFVTDQASEEDLAHHGLDKPAFTVQLTLDEGGKDSQKTLTLAKQKEGATDHVYAKIADQPFIAEVPTSVLKDLDVKLADLRDKTIVTFDQSAVRGLKFEAGSESFAVARQGGGEAGAEAWALLPSAGVTAGPAKKWKLTSLVSTLHDLKGNAIVSDQPDAKALALAGLDHPVKTVAVIGEGDKVIAKILIGKTDQSKVSLQLAGSPRLFTVDAYKLANVPATAADLIDAPMAKPDGGPSTAMATPAE